MDPIKELLAKLASDKATEVTDAQITEGLAAIKAGATELAAQPVTEENHASLVALRDARRALLAVQAQRKADAEGADNAAELAEKTKELLAELAELPGTHDPSTDNVQPDPEVAKVPDPGKAGEAAPEEEEEDKTKRKAPRKRGARELGDLTGDPSEIPAETAGTVMATTRVSGNVPGRAVGEELSSADSLTKAFKAKAEALAGKGGAAGRHDVARIVFTYPEERTLSEKASEVVNTAKINAATGPEGLTAAGLCLPLETRYDIETIGVTDRPVKNALSGFQTERGGLQYRAPFDALAMTEGMGVWTQDDDAAVDPADPLTLKSCFEVACPGLLNASIYSTYLCLEFANMTARFDSEFVTATTESSMVAWARFAENQLLSRLAAGSKFVKGVHQLGAVRDLLLNFDRLAAYYRSRHRLNDTQPLHMIAPRWLIDLLRSDLAMAFSNASPAEVFAIAQATLESFLSTRNINVTWHLDGLDAVTVSGMNIPNQYYGDLAAGADVPPFPAIADVLLFKEGDWLFLDGGTLDLGLVRDSTLNLRNRYQTFVETFEGVAFVGKECLRMGIPLVPSGASTGTIDPHAIDPTLPAVVAAP